MRVVLMAGLLMAGTLPAFASGGLSCEAEGGPARIAVESGVTRGMGSPVFNFRGSAVISDTAIAEDLRTTAFTGEYLAQYWFDGEDLRLVLYREREGDKPHGYVEITVLTRADGDEGGYVGTYKLTAYDGTGDDPEGRTVKLDGKIGCFVE
ncbi:hypothetical protein ACSBOB_05680 [Mesorhizobium sp. ASY16-5R]|uniref:hypothetical protein n=1 Tax=Mesorhizobium sp. ASY16-5R TaxID=3445772 RepID=UPI003F9F3574